MGQMKVYLAAPADAQRDPRPLARRAEAAAYDGLWLSEVRHDPFLAATLAATATARLELGTSIAVAFARSPMSTAVLANDLQVLTGGRFVLGLGTQVKAHITRRFSMPWGRPAERLREYVHAVRAIWRAWESGEPLEFAGEFYTHTLMPPAFVPEPHPFGPPPVLLAGVGSALTEVAGEVADGFLPHGFTTERYLRTVTLPALERGRARSADPSAPMTVCGAPMIATGRTDEQRCAAAAAVRAQIAFYGSTPAYSGILELHGWGELGADLHALSRAGRWSQMSALIGDDVLGTFAVVAEPDRVVAELDRRFGTVFDRLSLSVPYPVDDGVLDEIAAGIQALTPAGSLT
jgi:probable F420-dependent oxidoreductase